MGSTARPVVSVIGAGRLARALLPALAGAGYTIAAISAPRIEQARAARRGLPRGVRACTDPVEAAADARLILTAVPDGKIASVARRLARAGQPWRGRVVLHHAGSLGTGPLEPLREAGAAVGVLHPLQCLGDASLAAEVLPGSRARIEGDPRAVTLARRLARDLSLVPLRMPGGITDRDRAVYHAAASLASNDLLALLLAAAERLEATGIPPREAMRALAALARGTLRHIEEGGPDAAFTGPAARGDRETLAAHMEVLAAADPETAEVHRLLSRRLARRAGSRGRSALRALGAGGRKRRRT